MSNLNSNPHPRFKDLTGQVFGRLTVLPVPCVRVGVKVHWLCSCTCGSEKLIAGGSLRSGLSRSCGCQQMTAARAALTLHGMTSSPEHRVWRGMWKRCTNQKGQDFAAYSKRTPPESWRDFTAFYAELGPRPSAKHSLERVRNDLPYGPGNCCWATVREQAGNTSRTIRVRPVGGGAAMSLKAACDVSGISYDKARRVVSRVGGGVEQATDGLYVTASI